MTAPVKFAVVGCGWWAEEHHMPAIDAHPAATLVATADPDQERRERSRERYDVEVFSDFKSMLSAVSADAVVISSPNRTHADFAALAIESGKHVLIEKPMALKGSDAHRLVALAESRDVHIVVGYPFQMTSTALELRDTVDSGVLGDLELITGTFTSSASYLFLDPGARRGPSPSTYSARSAGGGQGQTQVTHILASALWTSGLRPERVIASMRFPGGEPPLDTVDAIVLDFNSGALGTISSLGTVPRGASRVQQVQYFGSLGRASHDLLTARVHLELHNGETAVYRLSPGEVPYPTSRPVDTLIELVKGTVAENLGPPREAANAVEIIEAAYISAIEGRPVDVSVA